MTSAARWLRVRLAGGGEALVAEHRICAVMPGSVVEGHGKGSVLLLERSDPVAIEGSLGSVEVQLAGCE